MNRVAAAPNRFDVYLVNLDPTLGSEYQKTRPCAVVSPDEINRNLATVLIAPMTTVARSYPTRAPCHFDGKDGQIALDQLRAVDKTRLVRLLGQLTSDEGDAVLTALAALFAP